MKYLSPFHILPKDFEKKVVLDKKTLKQARKIVLAEFELQGQTTIFINDQEFDKNAVLRFFDNLEKDTNLELHSIIFKEKYLLHFLEKSDIEDYPKVANFIASKNYPNPQKFQQFVAPYFTTVYNDLLYNALRINDKDKLFLLIEQPFPLATEYESSAYQSSYRWFHQRLLRVEELEKALKEGEFVSSKDVYELIDPSFIQIFNELPAYFSIIRDKYAFKLYELIVLLNNKYKRVELARDVLDAGKLLKADDFTKQYYSNADKVIDKKTKRKSRFNWLWIYIIAQLIFIFFRIGKCNQSSSPSYNYEFKPIPQELYVPDFNEILKEENVESLQRLDNFDSLIKEINKSLSADSFKIKPFPPINIDDLEVEEQQNQENLDSLLIKVKEKFQSSDTSTID